MRKNPGREFLTLILGILIFPGAAARSAAIQGDSQAAKIFRDCSRSVLLLTIKSEQGEILGQATGFVVQGGIVVTNEHVVRNGQVFVETGVASIPVSVQMTDAYNDLAVLKPGIELAVAPLPISKAVPSPGDPVYTISNPVGLEKSLSTGVVSNVREFDGRRLVQITAPISHGSSGGPVLNGLGEVIGVAVGMLKDGQNLNFAVPADKISDLMSGKPVEGGDTSGLLANVRSLQSDLRKLQYSREEDSEYQRTRAEIRTLLETALKGAGGNLALLMELCDLSTGYAADVAVFAAEKAVAITPNFETQLKLGKALESYGWWGKDEDRAAALKRAEGAYRECLKLAKGPSADVLSALAGVLEGQNSNIEAERYFADAYKLYKADKAAGEMANCLRGLIRTSYALGKKQAGKSWFEALVDSGSVTYWDWTEQGSRLEEAKEYHDAGAMYQQAASAGGEWGWTTWADAARMYWMNEEDYDAALGCARKCLSDGMGKKDSEETMALAYKLIANILNERGVYSEALNHARESLALNPNDPWTHDLEAEALIGLRRFLEATRASEQAIRLSDGKFALMHFHLGYACFELEDWEKAQQSYRKVADMEKSETAAPYNVAICLAKLGYYRDAAMWYEEVLHRNPNHPKRQDILRQIELLRR